MDSHIGTSGQHAKQSQFDLESPYDKLRLVGQYWPISTGTPRAVVLFAHVSGEHCQRYKHVAEFFTERGISCVSYDIRGHGLSEGERGFAIHIDALLDDLECAITYTRTQLHLNMPLIIYAHGTGCSVCIAHVLRRTKKPLDCQYLILNTPSICLKMRPSAPLFFVARAFANLSPHFRLPIEGNFKNTYTTDPVMVEIYRNDPLVHDRWPARTLCLFLELGYRLETTAIEFPVPVLVQHGADDKITPVETIEKWVNERIKSKDVLFKSWPGHLHELHNDLGREDVLGFAFDWIEKHLQNTQDSATATT